MNSSYNPSSTTIDEQNSQHVDDTVIEINNVVDEDLDTVVDEEVNTLSKKQKIEEFVLEKIALILIRLEPTYHQVHDFIKRVRKMQNQPEDYMVGINLYGDEAGTQDEKIDALKIYLRDFIRGHVPKGKSFAVGWVIKIALSELFLEHIGMDFIPATVAGISLGSVIALRFYPIFNDQTIRPVQETPVQENAQKNSSFFLLKCFGQNAQTEVTAPELENTENSSRFFFLKCFGQKNQEPTDNLPQQADNLPQESKLSRFNSFFSNFISFSKEVQAEPEQARPSLGSTTSV